MPDPCECVVNDLRLLAEDMDKEPRHMGGLVRYDTAYALAGLKYLTFKEDDGQLPRRQASRLGRERGSRDSPLREVIAGAPSIMGG